MTAMKWYSVTKKIGGKSYLYRQRTYREGGKVRTQSQYVGAVDEHRDWVPKKRKRNMEAKKSSNFNRTNDLLLGPEEALENCLNKSNSFWPENETFQVKNTKKSISRSGISISAMKAEYARVTKHLSNLGIDPSKFSNISLMEGEKAGWCRKNKMCEVTLAKDEKGSGRNRFKKTYRLALAHAFLDTIETQSPSLYDRFRTMMDLSWFNTKMVVTEHILRSDQRHKIWVTLQFLWSGSLPRSLERKFGKHGHQKLQPYMPGTWRDEAAELIADIIQRGYIPCSSRAAKDRSKAKSSAKRAFNAYRKLGPVQRFTAKGRKKWKLYKKHEAKFLLANHRKLRLEMLKPFLVDFHR